MIQNRFVDRHIGPGKEDATPMLEKIGVASIDQLIDETVPNQIRLKEPLDLPDALSEFEYQEHVRYLGSQNQLFKSYIGLGYYGCIIPPVIQRNVLENPGWYTAYTPYQAEISQGRMEALLNFQTMVMDLTAMEIANASLLDESTAAAEAMTMFYNTRSREAVHNGCNRFLVSNECLPQTIAVLQSRAKPLGIEIVLSHHKDFELSTTTFGLLLQYPTATGLVQDYRDVVAGAKRDGIRVAVAADLLSLALLIPPGEWGADVVVGNTQRFGVPVGYGGPHAAYFACKEEFKRNVPGRIIGVSIDQQGDQALRMALQTREQHIRRDKATSNICTAQALLAVMASMYAVYHGAEGIRSIAQDVHEKTAALESVLKELGIECINEHFFDTLLIKLADDLTADQVKTAAEAARINFYYPGDGLASISIDETTSVKDLQEIADVFSEVTGKSAEKVQITPNASRIPDALTRQSSYLQHPVFSRYHSETELMRYLKSLENKDLSLTHSMISLGSCTMKLNAVSELYPITMPEFTNLHPFAPPTQAQGYTQMIDELEQWLCKITGFAAISFQPNSGAQGEYAGLLVIKAFHEANGDKQRDVALIPASAHGTNPASAVMAGMQVVVVKCDEQGNIDLNDLREKASEHKDRLAALMVTYPSTHGVFEEAIMEVTRIIHENGGQVYMDGANMNAQVGLTNPAIIGADVCHLNLHKTFAIPHGGGGPGVGPIGVAEHLIPHLPGHPLVDTGNETGIPPIASAPWGSALILLISYGYLKMLGGDGLTECTRIALLNANYIKSLVRHDYPILYEGNHGHIAHELILDCRGFKKTAQVEVEDIAKRLIDYGFHAPTVSFPVPGTLMVEPTESESKEELERFCEALHCIRQEIDEIEDGIADQANNVLKNSPHTAFSIASEEWDHPYSRTKATYPADFVKSRKYWSPVARVDNAYGDRNLVCSCPPVESYATEPA